MIIPYTNVLGRKFDIAVKGHSWTIFVLINLVDFESKMLYTKIQHQNFVGSGE